MIQRRRWHLTLEDIEADDESVHRRLRLLLKHALRRLGLRNLGLVEVPPQSERERGEPVGSD